MNPKSILITSLVFCTLASVLLLWRVPIAHAAQLIIAVDTTTDSNAAAFQVCSISPNDCSLRGAISKANGDSSNNYTIILPAGTYTLTVGGAGEDNNATGDLDIRTSMTISGASSATTVIQGGPGWDDRILNILTFTATRAQISGVTIRNGHAISNTVGGGIAIGGSSVVTLTSSVVTNNIATNSGGGIHVNTAILTLINSSIISNSASGGSGGGIYMVSGSSLTMDAGTLISNTATGGGSNGGGLFAQGIVTITNSTISGNSAAGGAGIDSLATQVTISNSTISGNIATGEGGGISNDTGIMTLTNSSVINNIAQSSGGFGNFGTSTTMVVMSSTISGNQSTVTGGGLRNSGTLTMTNSTISGNKANDSGGALITLGGSATLNNVTIANNIADADNDSFGLGGGFIWAGGTLNIANTLIGTNINNNGEPDCAGTITSQGYNLIGITTGCTISGTLTGVISNTNPLIGPLANVGGSTAVHTLLPNSPAINAGNPGASDGIGTHCMPTDQRGVGRPIGGQCDMGAFEGTGAVLFLPLIMK